MYLRHNSNNSGISQAYLGSIYISQYLREDLNKKGYLVKRLIVLIPADANQLRSAYQFQKLASVPGIGKYSTGYSKLCYMQQPQKQNKSSGCALLIY